MAMSSDPDRPQDNNNEGRLMSRQGQSVVILLSVVIATLTGIAAGSLTAWVILRQAQNEPVVALQNPQITYVQEPEASAAAVYQAVAPSVVTVFILDEDGEDRPRLGSGTGIIVDGEGHILTNNHVVSEAERVRVRLLDGSTLFAEVVGTDPSTDLAVIQADFPPGSIQIARFGDSEAVKPGDPVFAIGSPYNYSHSITAGIVSGVGRAYPDRDSRLRGLIQSDAEINPGNSGGPLLNANGEVIGITTAIQTNNNRFMGIGLSIPSNLVQQLLPQLIRGERIQRAFLGVSMGRPITQQLARANNLEIDYGVSISRVVPGGPAQQAGIRGLGRNVRTSDIITAIDGRPMKTADDLIAYIQTKDVGDEVTIEVYRNGETLELTATLGTWPENR